MQYFFEERRQERDRLEVSNTFEKNIDNFAKKSNVIFLCYPNNIFKKLEK